MSPEFISSKSKNFLEMSSSSPGRGAVFPQTSVAGVKDIGTEDSRFGWSMWVLNFLG